MVDLAKHLGPFLVALLGPITVVSGARAEGEQPLPALPAPSAAPETPPPAPPVAGAARSPAGAAAAPSGSPPPVLAGSTSDLPDPPNTPCSGNRSRCHDGFYARMGLGLGVTGISGQGPSGSVSISGGSIPFRLAIGGTVGKSVVLGAALFGAATAIAPSTSGIEGAEASFGALNFLVDWFPSPEGGWHVGGDIGLGVVGLTHNVGAGGDLALSVFGGYDWWFTDQWSFGPMLSVSGGTAAPINDSNNNDTGYRLKPASIALLASFLYH